MAVTLVPLWEENDQTVSGLGGKHFLESNTLTPILKKLEAMGYIERARRTGAPGLLERYAKG